MAKPPELKEHPMIAVAEKSAWAGIGLYVAYKGGLRWQANEARKIMIKNTRFKVEQKMKSQGNIMPDFTRSPLKEALATVGTTKEQIPVACRLPQTRAEMIEACRVLKGPSDLVLEYNRNLSAAGVPMLEKTLLNDTLTNVLFIGGGSTALICGSLAVCATAEVVTQYMVKKFPRLSSFF